MTHARTMLITAALAALLPATPAAAATERLHASLGPRAEVPGPGKANASGSATVRVNRSDRRVCYSVNFQNIPGVTMAHIHRGAAGVAGPPVVTLNRAGTRGFQGCTRVARGLARELTDTPRRFYVNVHSRAFPDGAIRGQLRR